jgi:hypothetical protein
MSSATLETVFWGISSSPTAADSSVEVAGVVGTTGGASAALLAGAGGGLHVRLGTAGLSPPSSLVPPLVSRFLQISTTLALFGGAEEESTGGAAGSGDEASVDGDV